MFLPLARYEQESKVQFVVDAVYAFALALHNLQRDVCPKAEGLCALMAHYDRGAFYRNYLLNVSFTGESNYARCIEAEGSKGNSIFLAAHPSCFTRFNRFARSAGCSIGAGDIRESVRSRMKFFPAPARRRGRAIIERYDGNDKRDETETFMEEAPTDMKFYSRPGNIGDAFDGRLIRGLRRLDSIFSGIVGVFDLIQLCRLNIMMDGYTDIILGT